MTERGISTEVAKAELQTAMVGPAGRQWCNGPAVSTVLAALAQAEQRIAELEARIEPLKPIAWIVHARTGDQLTQDGDYVANAEGMANIHSTPLYAAPLAQPVAVPDGYALVPVDPTPAMMAEICLVEGWTERALKARYQAMLAAAPVKER